MVAGMLLLLATGGFFSPHPVVIAVQILGLCLMIWARKTFGLRSMHATASPTEGGLVTSGPYRYLRHPIYASALYIAWAGALGNFSPAHLAFALMAFAGAYCRIICEESLVRTRYPEYDEYARKTKRFIPYFF
jgi:protein-S-isoprenylcysteine O-methyltransferase Ste14